MARRQKVTHKTHTKKENSFLNKYLNNKETLKDCLEEHFEHQKEERKRKLKNFFNKILISLLILCGIGIVSSFILMFAITHTSCPEENMEIVNKLRINDTIYFQCEGTSELTLQNGELKEVKNDLKILYWLEVSKLPYNLMNLFGIIGVIIYVIGIMTLGWSRD